ncbi:hypothetical protein OJF2_37440 [Aquisphaera giovannonii]|uniref:Uncharacterized protein n=1 Tax=Aquisphaera giovannonii TaxID=406548 RepID=A0A5B9W4N0_9BACT|nr:hypothetical protein [Aquisphaera giovannonii]QEH35197.1 hypothetical protein OJF2_37440 [Aquisphaera giovannonii]
MKTISAARHRAGVRRAARSRVPTIEPLEPRRLLAYLDVVTGADVFSNISATGGGTNYATNDSAHWSDIDTWDHSQSGIGGDQLHFNRIPQTSSGTPQFYTDVEFSRESYGGSYDNKSLYLASGLPFLGEPTAYSLSGGLGGPLTVKIDPGPGEAVGQPVTLTLSSDFEDYGDSSFEFDATYAIGGASAVLEHADPAHPTVVGQGGKDATLAAKIGDTFQIGFHAKASGSEPDYQHAAGGYDMTLGMTVDVTRPLITAESLDWDPKGGVDFAYSVATTPIPVNTRVEFYWIDDEGNDLAELPELGFPISAGSGLAAVGDHNVGRLNLTAPPPQGATALEVDIDPDGTVDADPDSVEYLDLDLDLNTQFVIRAKYDGSSDPDVIGRFFQGVKVPGEDASFTLPDGITALGPATVTATLGGLPLALTKTGTGSYTTADFDPSGYANGTALKVTVSVGGKAVATQQATLDVEPLPKWYTTLGGKATFDASSGAYTFKASLLDVHTSGSFALPALAQVPGLWFGAGQDSGLDATIALNVQAGLDPTETPHVQGTFGADLTFLGQEVYKNQFDSDQQGSPFTISIALDPKTLALQSGTVSYSESHSQDVGLFKGQLFHTSFFQMLSAIDVNLTEDLGLDITLNADGSFTDSQLTFDLKGTLSGNLADLSFTSSSAGLGILKLVNRLAPQAILKNLISEALDQLGILPDFSMKAGVSGSIEVAGAVQLTKSTAFKIRSSSTDLDLSLTPALYITWLGDTEKVVGLPDAIGNYLKISYHTKKP